MFTHGGERGRGGDWEGNARRRDMQRTYTKGKETQANSPEILWLVISIFLFSTCKKKKKSPSAYKPYVELMFIILSFQVSVRDTQDIPLPAPPQMPGPPPPNDIQKHTPPFGTPSPSSPSPCPLRVPAEGERQGLFPRAGDCHQIPDSSVTWAWWPAGGTLDTLHSSGGSGGRRWKWWRSSSTLRCTLAWVCGCGSDIACECDCAVVF